VVVTPGGSDVEVVVVAPGIDVEVVVVAPGIEVEVVVATWHTGTVIVFASVVTVPPAARALPVKFAKCPIVIPASSMIVPTNVGVSDSAAFAPSVVAPTGAQNTSQADAPFANATIELAPVLSAPPGLKIQTLPTPPVAVRSRVTVVDRVTFIAPPLE
jgi:hypothetical protein